MLWSSKSGRNMIQIWEATGNHVCKKALALGFEGRPSKSSANVIVGSLQIAKMMLRKWCNRLHQLPCSTSMECGTLDWAAWMCGYQPLVLQDHSIGRLVSSKFDIPAVEAPTVSSSCMQQQANELRKAIWKYTPSTKFSSPHVFKLWSFNLQVNWLKSEFESLCIKSPKFSKAWLSYDKPSFSLVILRSMGHASCPLTELWFRMADPIDETLL